MVQKMLNQLVCAKAKHTMKGLWDVWEQLHIISESMEENIYQSHTPSSIIDTIQDIEDAQKAIVKLCPQLEAEIKPWRAGEYYRPWERK